MFVLKLHCIETIGNSQLLENRYIVVNIRPKSGVTSCVYQWSLVDSFCHVITVWTVVQAVLTATFNSYGNRQISTPYKISTPEPIEKKFSTDDYVREGTPYTKFGTDPPTEGFWANGWNITKIIFIYTFFSETRVQVRPVDGFLRAIAH